MEDACESLENEYNSCVDTNEKLEARIQKLLTD
jgi:hypothetical protein